MAVDWRRELPELEVLEEEPMAGRTTFRIGGPARWFLCPRDETQAAQVLALCRREGIVPFFLGNGSNLLVADEGYEGVVLSTRRLNRLEEEDGLICSGSGVLLSRLANFALEHGLTGLEFTQGIPGSVGGGVRMNAGAYGGELGQVVEWVDALDSAGTRRRFSGAECGFSYRHSLFCREPFLVLGAAFRLEKGEKNAIRAAMEDYAQRRREKQPLEFPSAGSTFKRPQGHYAAALIDSCGLKGLRVGDAQVSEKHAGFLINRGHATAAEMLALMAQVRDRVREETGVELEPEVETLPPGLGAGRWRKD